VARVGEWGRCVTGLVRSGRDCWLQVIPARVSVVGKSPGAAVGQVEAAVDMAGHQAAAESEGLEEGKVARVAPEQLGEGKVARVAPEQLGEPEAAKVVREAEEARVAVEAAGQSVQITRATTRIR